MGEAISGKAKRSRLKYKYVNYYNVLDVSILADRNEITKAYQAIIRQIDMDRETPTIRVNGYQIDEKLAEKAFQTLSVSSERKKFDSKLRQWLQYKSISCFIRPLTWTESLYMEGLGYLENGDHQSALVRFQKLLKFDEQDNPILYRLVTEAFTIQESLTHAISAAENSITIDPQSDECLLLLGKLYERDDQLRKARDCFVEAFKINPKNVEIRKQYDRGSLVNERISKLATRTGQCFLPDKNAKSFRLEEGLIPHHVLRGILDYIKKLLTPMPNHLSFKLVKH